MILTTLNQFQIAVPTAVGVQEWTDLETYVQSAEIWLKRNVLGTGLYNKIIEEIEEAGSGSGERYVSDELLRLCRNVIANHAYWDAIPFLDVVHTDSGFGVIQSTNKAPASKERVERLRQQCLIRRDAEVDNLIAYLYENDIYHDLWKADSVFSDMFDSLLPTVEIFRRYNNIADRATLDKLRPSIVAVQNTIVADAISQELVDELVEAQKDDDFTPHHNDILPRLRDAIAKLAIAHGVDDMSVIVDSTGILRAYTIGATSYADESRLSMFKSSFLSTGMKLLDKVVHHINENVEDFPTYVASELYTARLTEGYENDEDSTIFSSL